VTAAFSFDDEPRVNSKDENAAAVITQQTFALFRPHQQVKGTVDNRTLGFEPGQLLRFVHQFAVDLNARSAHARYRTLIGNIYVQGFKGVTRIGGSMDPAVGTGLLVSSNGRASGPPLFANLESMLRNID
jgi:hypothetical protein